MSRPAPSRPSTASTAEERVRVERRAQGLPTPAAPVGDPTVDANVAAAYRTTAMLLAVPAEAS